MKKPAKAILEELKSDGKERVMFYIDKDLQTKFKKVCAQKKVRMSNVVERLIQDFLDEIKEK
ncbi:plasmid partition protein ParG [Bdellovibrio bacteriovorus]|uniref:plasmid partition protein ParG n=1 Tax=Bdellovibrio bacteriovorus TaxID=959 RepID=UPI0035A66839